MRILVIGGGGREHALAWKIARSPLVEKVFCAPGNAGTVHSAQNVAIAATDIPALVEFADNEKIDLTVVGPEAPLIGGIVDRFEARGLPVFGPSTDPARIEGSKAFAKQLMRSSGIPTADFWICESTDAARGSIHDYYLSREPDAKIVVKADGLAAGKGVIIADSEPSAIAAVEKIMDQRAFGTSGDRVVLEEFLVGEEASIMAVTDGETVIPLLPSQDHKRALDGDQGPNTGGMGAYAPVPLLEPAVIDDALERILKPAIRAVRDLGIPYRGVLYAGIVNTAQGIKAIEFNCRFGDPETQAVLPLMESDIVPLLLGVTDCSLDTVEIKWRPAFAVCVVAASRGYPVSEEKGVPISGADESARSEGCLVFHSGTAMQDGTLVTNGGRVLSVTGVGDDLMTATAVAYVGISRVRFDGMQYRRDIAGHALRTLSA